MAAHVDLRTYNVLDCFARSTRYVPGTLHDNVAIDDGARVSNLYVARISNGSAMQTWEHESWQARLPPVRQFSGTAAQIVAPLRARMPTLPRASCPGRRYR